MFPRVPYSVKDTVMAWSGPARLSWSGRETVRPSESQLELELSSIFLLRTVMERSGRTMSRLDPSSTVEARRSDMSSVTLSMLDAAATVPCPPCST